MAEWLRTGLQIRLRRFDSGSGLQAVFCYVRNGIALAESRDSARFGSLTPADVGLLSAIVLANFGNFDPQSLGVNKQ